MRYGNFLKSPTPQRERVRHDQIMNSAGGFTFDLSAWTRLHRFLILGTEGNTYYATERKQTLDNCQSLLACIKEDGERTVREIVAISDAGRAPKNDAAIFALALCAAQGDLATRAAAYDAVPKVCRTGTHLFQFAEESQTLRGWGRGLRRAVGSWYLNKAPEALAFQAVKYPQRNGWSHRDLLRLSKPKGEGTAVEPVLRYITKGEVPEGGMIEAVERLRTLPEGEAAAWIAERRIPREAIPTELMTRADVWEAMLPDMGLTALLRNLGNLSKVGVLTVGSEASHQVIARITDANALRKARVHPLHVLIAQSINRMGRGLKGSGTWEPVPRVVDALDDAFYASFGSLTPTGKRFMIGLDVSGSMGMGTVAGSFLTPRNAEAAMMMATLRTEEACHLVAFSDELVPFGATPQTRLSDVVAMMDKIPFGRTDCAQPMLHAAEQRIEVDAFVIYTDNETWYGTVHPFEALKAYRQKMGIDAKLVVAGMTATRFSIADPTDAGMLDVVGMDGALPQVIAEFVAG